MTADVIRFPIPTPDPPPCPVAGPAAMTATELVGSVVVCIPVLRAALAAVDVAARDPGGEAATALLDRQVMLLEQVVALCRAVVGGLRASSAVGAPVVDP